MKAFLGVILGFFFCTGQVAEAQLQRQIKVLTFNTWLLPIGKAAKTLDQRVKLIADSILESDADIVSLQEVWKSIGVRDRSRVMRELIERLKVHYPHHYMNEGSKRLGDGLLILSKKDFPIRAHSEPLTFKNCTALDECLGVKKGALHVEIEVPGVGLVDFYNAHLGASYASRASRTGMKSGHVRRRRKQVDEFKDYVERTRKHKVQILAVDLNTSPYEYDRKTSGYTRRRTAEYMAVVNGLGLLDTFHDGHEFGEKFSFDKKANPNASQGEGANARIPSETVDYVFVSKGGGKPTLIPESSELVFDQAHEGVYASDHYGVLTTFASPAQ